MTGKMWAASRERLREARAGHTKWLKGAPACECARHAKSGKRRVMEVRRARRFAIQ